ncbi:MAG: hypothetical protein U0354_20425 [Candidatus Sericytochromatia bacterium]
MTSEELLRSCYKYLDYNMYILCKNSIKKYKKLDLEFLFLELYYKEPFLLEKYFKKDKLNDFFKILKKEKTISKKSSKYLLLVFSYAKDISKNNSSLFDYKIFLEAIINTKNPISEFFNFE